MVFLSLFPFHYKLSMTFGRTVFTDILRAAPVKNDFACAFFAPVAFPCFSCFWYARAEPDGQYGWGQCVSKTSLMWERRKFRISKSFSLLRGILWIALFSTLPLCSFLRYWGSNHFFPRLFPFCFLQAWDFGLWIFFPSFLRIMEEASKQASKVLFC
ncbi:hypothetical protein EJ08DRAFT_181173 [Tothia fuscella]|uniref:Uncharacterized protein n=1 Tax=Tothia fuscella TaxID=1048955 RepID=A0A9P4NU00_9PEZI|nr:hypothetical protein EJ08DRAFT_181173 [Tothia fuscella]